MIRHWVTLLILGLLGVVVFFLDVARIHGGFLPVLLYLFLLVLSAYVLPSGMAVGIIAWTLFLELAAAGAGPAPHEAVWPYSVLLALIGVLSVMLSLRLRSLAELQKRAIETDAVLASLNDAVIVLSADGKVIRANPAAVRGFGLDPVGGDWTALARRVSLRHLDSSPVVPEEMPPARALQGEYVVGERLLLTNVLGRELVVQTSASPLALKGERAGAVLVSHDVTGIADLERLKDGLMAEAAHELKTPVAIMKGYAQALLETGIPATGESRAMLEAIDRGANWIDRIVEGLLDLSELQLGRLDLASAKFDLGEMVRELVGRKRWASGSKLPRLAECVPAEVMGDRDRLEQVVVNLVDNAMKYSPAGGEVLVGVAVEGDEAVVRVSDHGVGIPADKQGRIFERFYRAHTGTAHDYGGMGVGLYISREIVGRHGGRMWFESREGEGSVFSFSLPLLRGKGAEGGR